MKNIYKIVILSLIVFCTIGLGCIEPAEQKSSPSTVEKSPTVKLDTSLERDLINKWLEEVGNPNNVMWVIHMSETGQVLGQWPVVGKVVSMSKSNEPYERVVAEYNGGPRDYEEDGAVRFEGYRRGTSQLANPSGTYGHDLPGVFFFTPDGAYHELHGGIIHVSSVPVSIKDPVFLTYDVDKELQAKEKMWEEQLRNESI